MRFLNYLDLDVKDYGNLSYEVEETREVDNMPHLKEVAACNHNLSKMVQQILSEGRQVLTLGGDHSLGIGTIDGHVKVSIDISVPLKNLRSKICIYFCFFFLDSQGCCCFMDRRSRRFEHEQDERQWERSRYAGGSSHLRIVRLLASFARHGLAATDVRHFVE